MNDDIVAGPGTVYLTEGAESRKVQRRSRLRTLGMNAAGTIAVNTATTTSPRWRRQRSSGTITYQDVDALTVDDVTGLRELPGDDGSKQRGRFCQYQLAGWVC